MKFRALGEVMERRLVVERKVLKCVVEARPLRFASIPPCSITAVALSSSRAVQDVGSELLIYLGTDTGHALLFSWINNSTTPKSSSRPLPLQNSPSRNAPQLSPRFIDVQQQYVPKGPPSTAGSDLDDSAIDLEDLKSSTSSPELLSDHSKCDLKVSAQKQLGRGAVESLCLLANARQLAVLVDGQVLLVNSLTLALLIKVSQTRGVSVIARAIRFEGKLADYYNTSISNEGVDSSRDISHFAVSARGKVSLVEVRSWQQEKENQAFLVSHSTPSPYAMKEVAVVEGILAMVWLGTSLFIGTRREYLLFSLLDGQATQLFSFPVDHPWRPIIRAFPKDLEVLLVIDNAGILVDATGQPVAGSLVFSGIPEAVGQSSPYALVVNKGTVELFHCKTGDKVQALPFGFSPVAKCLVADDFENTVVIANADKVSCFVQVSIDEQLKDLLKQKEFTEALKLVEECDDGTAKTKRAYVHAEAGFLLLSDLRFKEAIDHFLQSEVVEPSELLPYFPGLSSRWRNLVPRKRYWSLHSPPQALHILIDHGLAALQNSLFSSLNGDQKETRASAANRNDLLNQHLMSAIGNFIRYWEATRSKVLTHSVKEAVDTVLMKLYIESGASNELEVLAASKNCCLLEEVEALLRSSGNLRALALLYESKDMLGPALELWQHLAKPGHSERGPLEVAATSQAARLLETSSDGSLVLRHVSWILRLDESVTLRILTSSQRKEPLQPDDVLRLLKSKHAVIRQSYLRWLIEEHCSDDPDIHTELAISLGESALKNSADEDLRKSLQGFLQESDKYDCGELLKLIGDTILWKEQAILHMKQGNEVLALKILALKLEDSEAAEDYCAELGRPDAYLQLLDMYLRPGNGGQPMYESAVHLLRRHGAALDPLKVLEALPSDMPLNKACEALVKMLRSRVHTLREGQIAKGLSKGINFQTRLSRLRERSRQIQITSDNICSTCRARIGTKLFAVYPDNSILCYKCLRLRGEH